MAKELLNYLTNVYPVYIFARISYYSHITHKELFCISITMLHVNDIFPWKF